MESQQGFFRGSFVAWCRSPEAKLAALGTRIEQSGLIPGGFLGSETWKHWKQSRKFYHVLIYFFVCWWRPAHDVWMIFSISKITKGSWVWPISQDPGVSGG